MEHKVAIVTGGNVGIGRAISLRLAAEGADVVITGRGLEDCQKVAAEVAAMGRRALPLKMDVAVYADAERMARETLNTFGKIDILVQCVGIRGPMGTPIVALDEETWQRIINVNLTGPFLITKAVAKTMIPDGEGKKIVLISSLAGSRGYSGSASYCASKHGVIGLAKTLAQELAQYKINVNIISPGAFDTNLRDESIAARAKAEGVSVAEIIEKQTQGQSQMAARIPLGRMGTPEDIADLVYFLVSDQSSYITGEEIRISGGGE